MNASLTPSRLHAALLFGALTALAAWGQSATTIPRDALAEPQTLHDQLRVNPHTALILQVGSRVLFDEDHIPGAEYAGPGSRAQGLDVLRARVQRVPRTTAILIYCGCCPWEKCPNLAPAWEVLHQMGFTRVRALHIAQNFGADWVARGYGAERSQ